MNWPGFVPEIGELQEPGVADEHGAREQGQEEEIAAGADVPASGGAARDHQGSLHAAAGSLRFEVDLAESRFVLRDILLQHIEQRFGLLRD